MAVSIQRRPKEPPPICKIVAYAVRVDSLGMHRSEAFVASCQPNALPITLAYIACLVLSIFGKIDDARDRAYWPGVRAVYTPPSTSRG
jgi:hypothetical protein